ncbi:hypothetical protein Pst134EA_022963 [Puccinia striiformis f. sp. tritici]|uniref:hypothetical protein n=1 Tax=Puccinia striiformis f. sp. tritici TaxID=168172 RepID=UPI002007C4EF|nr:hypothetical protein Pst134EA_022963 [Puccinia striiformis f. sp. tritici]KAH9455501.1 hypothetical protein Pst134EA_022963 [Puccinia striiformis f. sp. tritici]
MHGVSWEDGLDDDGLDPDRRRGTGYSALNNRRSDWDRPSSDYYESKGYSDPLMDDTIYRQQFDGHEQPSGMAHGVSDEDWNDAREELAHLGFHGGSEDLRSASGSDRVDSYTHDHHSGRDGAEQYRQFPSDLDDYSSGHHRDRYSLSEVKSSPDFHHTEDGFNHHDRSFHSPLEDSFSPARQSSNHHSLHSPVRSDYGPEHAGSDLNTDHRNFDYDSLNYSNNSRHHLQSEDDPYGDLVDDRSPVFQHKHQHADDFDSGLGRHHERHQDHFSVRSQDDDLLYPHHYSQSGASESRFENSQSMADVDQLDPLTSTSDYTEFPYDGDHHSTHSDNHFPVNSFQDPLEYPEPQRAYRIDDYHKPSLTELSQHSPIGNGSFLNGGSRQSPSLSSPPFSVASGVDRPDDLNTHEHLNHRQSYTSHQQSHLHDQYHRTAPQGYQEDDLHQSPSYRPDYEHSTLGHSPHNAEQRHISPRDDIERMRAELDDSLARDASLLAPQRPSEVPLSRSWDSTSSVPGRRSPHLRSFDTHSVNQTRIHPTLERADLSYPVTSREETDLLSTLERPRSRSDLSYSTVSGRRSPYAPGGQSPYSPYPSEHPVRSREETNIRTTTERPRSRSDLPYSNHPGRRSPYAPGRRSPYLSGRRSPSATLPSAAWPSPAVNMKPATRVSSTRPRTPVMGVLGPGNQPGAFLHHQDSLRDQLHQISDLNNHIRHSELAHQRERALVDRTAAELARQSLTDELRRSEAARERDLALVDRQVSQLAQHSLAKDLRRNEIAHQRDLALADQQVSQLAQHSLAKDLRRNEIAHQRELALADQRASQLSQQSVVQAVRENEVYRELAHQRHQLDLERAEIARQKDRVETQTQLGTIDRQLRAIDRQREVDSNRQMANLSRFGNLPSVLRGNYEGRPLASPYLQQSRFLSAARRWSARDKPRPHSSPVVFDHVDAYYRLISDHLPRQLPLFKDPYYNYDSHILDTSSRNPLRPISSAPLIGRNSGMCNPFVDGIDYDYGYGKVGSLGLKLDQFAREQAYILDDLYLYELLLRLDESIDELERQRRWQARLRWEESLDNHSRVQRWKKMTADERRTLGLSEGSYWASSLFGIPLDARFGYRNIPNFSRYKPAHLRTHFPLSSRLASRFPMFSRGGLGLGRRISNWYDYDRRPPINTKYLDRQEQIRREYAQRRGEILPGSSIRPHSLMLSGAHTRGPLTGLGATRTLGQHLPPLQPLSRTASLTSGLLSRGVSSTVPRGLTGTPHLSSSAKTSVPISMRAPLHASSTQRSHHTPTSHIHTTIKSKIPGPAYPLSLPAKSLSGHSTTSRPAVVATKPIPIKPIPSSTSNSLRPPSTAPATSRTSSIGHPSPGISARPKTPTGAPSPYLRSTTPTVLFNPRVKAVPPESETDPPPPPRPPSRNAARPPRSVLKTPPPTVSKPSTNHHRLDDERLESITKINTERNRATPAPPSPKTPRGTN